MKFIKIFIYTLIFIEFYSCKKEDLTWNLKKAPEITDLKIENNTLNDITLAANCSSDGYDKNTEKGICWSVNPIPTINNNTITCGNGKGMFSTQIAWDTYSKIYIRAFAKNTIATVYSNELEISWPGTSANKPVITSISATNVAFTSVDASGQLISNGGLAISNKGFCISQNPMPTITNAISVINSNTSNNTYTVNFQNLTNNTTYYLCAFATNIAGTSYGNILSITTKKFYSIGETGPTGGLIFYSKEDTIGGWNFLEAATNDFTTTANWNAGNSNLTNASGAGIGIGLFNTNLIYGQYGNGNYAAALCYNYSLMGYNDWFLPSRDEIIKMYDNLFLSGIGNFSPNTIYWSSTEDAVFNQNSWTVKMSSATTNNFLSFPKSSIFKIRPIRRF